MDMRGYHGTLARLENAKPLDLSNPHNLFNPVQWRVVRGGTVLKVESGNEIGAGAIVLSETKPLYLKIEYRGTTGSAGNTRYRFAVTREAGETKKKRLRMTTTATKENKDTRDLFTLLEVIGDELAPTAFKLRLAGDSGSITIEKGKLFQRIDGYTASLAYDTRDEKKSYVNKRVGDKLFCGGWSQYRCHQGGGSCTFHRLYVQADYNSPALGPTINGLLFGFVQPWRFTRISSGFCCLLF